MIMASVRPAPAPGAAHVAINVAPADLEQIPDPPCTYHLCGRVACGPIDGLMTAGETFTGIAAIALGVTGNYLTCGLMGGASVICMISHASYRKWGNLAAIIDRFNRVQQHFSGALAAQTAEVGRLGGEVNRISGLNDQFQKETEDFRGQNEALRKRVDEISQSLQTLQGIDAGLKATNALLVAQVSNLQHVNDDIKARIREFTAQNGAFKAEIQSVGALLPRVDAADHALDHEVAHIDADIDRDIADLGRELAATQNLVKQIVAAFQKEKEEVQAQISAFNAEEFDLDQASSQMAAERRKFALLQEAYAKLSAELEHLRAQMAPAVSAIGDEARALQPVVSDIQHEREALVAAGDALAPAGALRDEFGHLQQHLTEAAEAQARANAELQRQLDEIGHT